MIALGTRYLDEGIVQQEHYGSEIPRDLRVPKEILPNVTHVTDIGMTQTESPDRGSILNLTTTRPRRATYQMIREV